MRAHVFGPLGMTDTTFDFERALRGNHAAAHAEDIDGKTTFAVMDVNRAIVPVRPAGGAWSSVQVLALCLGVGWGNKPTEEARGAFG